jgi:hypothetical protein
MSVTKIWSLAAGLFFISILASTLQVSAAMPKSAKPVDTQNRPEVDLQHTNTTPLISDISLANMACALPKGVDPLMTSCRLNGVEK